MRAISFENYGDPLTIIEADIPRLQAGEVLVKMKYAAINVRDYNLRSGLFRNDPYLGVESHILGNEGAGEIIEAAEQQPAYPIGTQVLFREAYHLRAGGTWQQYVVARVEGVVPVPAGKSLAEAAALRTGFQSAWVALEIGGFEPEHARGQIILAPTIGGSVGNAVVQIVTAFSAEAISTAGSTQKASKAASLGYTNIVDLSCETLEQGTRRLLGERVGVDIAIDTLGGPYVAQALAVLKRGGTVVVMGTTAGREISFSTSLLVQAKRRILSLNLLLESPERRRKALNQIMQLWEEERICPRVDTIFPFTEVVEAQNYMLHARPFGKVLLAFHESGS